jgi:hypothetical protein
MTDMTTEGRLITKARTTIPVRVPKSSCGCCWRTEAEDGSPIILGALAMPGRRTFLICADCVTFLWHHRHPMSEASQED